MTMAFAFAFLLLGSVACVANGTLIEVSPSTDQFIAVNSMENVTFSCDVRETNGASAVWTVQGRQIPNDPLVDNPTRGSFEALGVFISVMDVGLTEVTITSMARLFFLNGSATPTPNVTVLCSSFIGTFGTIDGDILTVTTFGPYETKRIRHKCYNFLFFFKGIPSTPTQLLLEHSPDDLNQLIFRWMAPEGQLAGVNTTYSVNIIGPFNFSNQTMETFVVFDSTAAFGCEPHFFSVFASNDAGPGPAATIVDTIPLCMLVELVGLNKLTPIFASIFIQTLILSSLT